MIALVTVVVHLNLFIEYIRPSMIDTER